MEINVGDTVKIIDTREGVVASAVRQADGGYKISFEGDDEIPYVYRTGVTNGPVFDRSVEVVRKREVR